ncbi:MAG: hypothetical protein R3C56_19210 [Pirellulaceae bacterium]
MRGGARSTQRLPSSRHALLLCGDEPIQLGAEVQVAARLQGMAGSHPRIADKSLPFHYHEFMQRTSEYQSHVLPRYDALRQSKRCLLEQAEQKLRISGNSKQGALHQLCTKLS